MMGNNELIDIHQCLITVQALRESYGPSMSICGLLSILKRDEIANFRYHQTENVLTVTSTHKTFIDEKSTQ